MAPNPHTEAAAAKVAPAYRNLLRHFAFYAEYHNNPINQWIHIGERRRLPARDKQCGRGATAPGGSRRACRRAAHRDKGVAARTSCPQPVRAGRGARGLPIHCPADRAACPHLARTHPSTPPPAACVPVIMGTAFVFLAPVSLKAYLPSAALSAAAAVLKRPLPTDAASLVAAAYAGYYLYLTPSALGLAAVGMVGGLCVGAHAWVAAAGSAAVRPALALHVGAWLAQFYGHGMHERRSPALLDNLAQALFMAPIFVLTEVAFKVGALAGFRAAVQPDVDRRIREHKAGAGGRKD